MHRHILKYSWVMFLFPSLTSFGQAQLPRLVKSQTATQLYVDEKAYLICGGELGNSTATTLENMQSVWPDLAALHLNTVLVPVYWELVEPQEGKFDFSLYQQLILEARQYQMKIIFLWFGAWKNSMSSHAPSWVKLDQNRFPRAQDEQGISQEILSCFSAEALAADQNALQAFMTFLKETDESEHTVIMVQVENEIGMLPSARDHQELAERAFKSPVPSELMNYLTTKKEQLVPELITFWETNGLKNHGTWEEVFGQSKATDEVFMAWHYARFVDELARTAKAVYPLPLYVNAALNRPGWEPGQYPSAGPLPHLMDIWQAAAPNLDFLAPDLYFPDFQLWCDRYTRQKNILFVPEHRFDETVSAKALFSIAHYHGLGFSPFSIESKTNPGDEHLSDLYGMIQNISPLLSEAIAHAKVDGVLLDKAHQESILYMGNYELTCRHDYTLPWTPGATTENWPTTSVAVIQTGEDSFFIAGTGVVITFKIKDDATQRVGLLKVDEGRFEGDEWHITRHLNGDQTHQGSMSDYLPEQQVFSGFPSIGIARLNKLVVG